MAQCTKFSSMHTGRPSDKHGSAQTGLAGATKAQTGLLAAHPLAPMHAIRHIQVLQCSRPTDLQIMEKAQAPHGGDVAPRTGLGTLPHR